MRARAVGTISAWSCDPGVNGFNTTNDYILGLSGEQVTEMAVAGNTTTWQHTNVYAAGTLLATYDSNGLHFYLNDALGTRRAQTDYAGVLEQTCSNLPFGDSLNCTNSIEGPTEHHFTGKERDVESGLDYFGARYYANSMERWLSPDKAFADQHTSNPQSWNLYEYVGNDPLGRRDESGHIGESSQGPYFSIDYYLKTNPGLARFFADSMAAGGSATPSIASLPDEDEQQGGTQGQSQASGPPGVVTGAAADHQRGILLGLLGKLVPGDKSLDKELGVGMRCPWWKLHALYGSIS